MEEKNVEEKKMMLKGMLEDAIKNYDNLSNGYGEHKWANPPQGLKYNVMKKFVEKVYVDLEDMVFTKGEEKINEIFDLAIMLKTNRDFDVANLLAHVYGQDIEMSYQFVINAVEAATTITAHYKYKENRYKEMKKRIERGNCAFFLPL